MNFFYNITKIFISSKIPKELSSSKKNHPLEKLILFHEQWIFSLLFLLSLFFHIILILAFGIVSEMFVEIPPPIRARIGVSYAKIPTKPTLRKRSNSFFEKPVLKKLDTDLKPKFKNIVPEKPRLKKPSLKNSFRKNELLKPNFTNTETPKLKISKPQINTSQKQLKKRPHTKPKLFNTQKPILLKNNPPDRESDSTTIPRFDKKIVPPSTIKSRESVLKPKNIKVPSFSQESIPQKNLDSSSFSNTFKPLSRKDSQINMPVLKKSPNISNVKPKNIDEPIENFFGEEQKNDTPLPENIIIPEEKESKNNIPVPDIKDLQKRKETQLAIEDYNNHISNQIKPNGEFPSGLFVRFLLTIIPSGEIIKYEIIVKSGFSPFDLAAELAVRNAVLESLPQALAENPPYIVPIRIVPQN